MAHRDEILQDVAAALDDSKISRLPEQDEARDQATAALDAARAGLDRSAQSLFASALGHVLEGSLGFDRPGKAFKAFKSKDLDAAVISELRVVCLQLATVNSLTDTDEDPNASTATVPSTEIRPISQRPRCWARRCSWRAGFVS